MKYNLGRMPRIILTGEKCKQTVYSMILLCLIFYLTGCGQNNNSTVPPIYAPKVYLTDTLNNRIVRLDDLSGNYLYWITVSGFVNPNGICRDPFGRIYVSDTGNNRVVRMADITGTNWVVFPSIGDQSDHLLNPSGINLDSFGNIYVVDTGNNRIVEITTLGVWIAFGGPGSGPDQFSKPKGVFIDSAGKIYVTDTGNNRVARMDDMNGTNWTSFSGFSGPVGVFADPAGNIYVSDTGNSRIVKLDPLGNSLASIGTAGIAKYQFSNPQGIYVDAAGKIYVTDTGNNRVVRMDDMNGTNWIALGSYGSDTNQFNQPTMAVFQ